MAKGPGMIESLKTAGAKASAARNGLSSTVRSLAGVPSKEDQTRYDKLTKLATRGGTLTDEDRAFMEAYDGKYDPENIKKYEAVKAGGNMLMLGGKLGCMLSVAAVLAAGIALGVWVVADNGAIEASNRPVEAPHASAESVQQTDRIWEVAADAQQEHCARSPERREGRRDSVSGDFSIAHSPTGIIVTERNPQAGYAPMTVRKSCGPSGTGTG